MSELKDHIVRAYQAREVLHKDTKTNAYRLFHGYSEGLHGLEIDRYGETVLINSKGANVKVFEPCAQILSALGSFDCIVAKERGGVPAALRGQMPHSPSTVLEHGLRYQVDVSLGTHPGLYLDARTARMWVQQHAEGRRVLNLFSFAGSLGVAAMAGGALSVTHVDTQKRALERCQANHVLNNQVVDVRDLARIDVQKFLRKTAKGKRRFGAVIVDPPPARPGSKSALSPAQLAPWVAQVVCPGAWILYFFHHSTESWDALETEVVERSKLSLKVEWRGRSGIDFPESDERSALRLSAFRVAA